MNLGVICAIVCAFLVQDSVGITVLGESATHCTYMPNVILNSRHPRCCYKSYSGTEISARCRLHSPLVPVFQSGWTTAHYRSMKILFVRICFTAVQYQLSPAFPPEARVVLLYRVQSTVSAASPAVLAEWPPRVPTKTGRCCLHRRIPAMPHMKIHAAKLYEAIAEVATNVPSSTFKFWIHFKMTHHIILQNSKSTI